jgi:soluble lytic murein transglycosylase-like protein
MLASALQLILATQLGSKEAIQEYITVMAMKHNYSVAKALSIAECESGFIAHAKNKGSTASGIFQIIDGTWIYTREKMGLSTTTSIKNYPKLNIEAGIFLLALEGDRHWDASKECWLPKFLARRPE